MTVEATKTLQAMVRDFFTRHLVIERNASSNTVIAYRDAIKLFLHHASTHLARPTDELGYEVLDVALVRSFLVWLEVERACGPRTRNQRLAALRAFVRYVASVTPEHLEKCREIRQLQMARFAKPEIEYLDEDEVAPLLASIDTSTTAGVRDGALILLLYNTGARVQEIVNLDISDIHDEAIPFVTLRGKGRKTRTCPLWSRTMRALSRWLESRRNSEPSQPLFLNSRERRLSRSGVSHILQRAQHRCGLSPRRAKRVTPHVIRHTTGMHLLKSGVDITTIAAWLGHAQLTTTHEYVEIDLRTKQAAIAANSTLPELRGGTYPSSEIIAWLENVGRTKNYVQ